MVGVNSKAEAEEETRKDVDQGHDMYTDVMVPTVDVAADVDTVASTAIIVSLKAT